MEQVDFDFGTEKPVLMEVWPARLTRDVGLVAVRQHDERIQLTEKFAAALGDDRHPEAVSHSLLSMVRPRVSGILADHEDQNNHDPLRSDPVFKRIADRMPDGPGLARSPTLSRFENNVPIGGQAVFLEGFP